MIVPTAAVLRCPPALYLPARAGIRFARRFRWPAAALDTIGCRNAFGLAAGVFACAAAVFAVMSYQDRQQEPVALTSVNNQTIAFRQKQPIYPRAGQAEAVDEQEGAEAAAPSNYPRLVRTLRFLNPDGWRNVGKRERVSQGKSPGLPAPGPTYRAEGIASWYGPDFHGRRTANGERYDMNGISAAHRTMPLPSYARVTNLDNGRSIIVRVNNRGPFVHNRIVDLSVGTAKALDTYRKGTARVRVEFVGRAPIEGSDDQMLLATLRTGEPAPAPSNVVVASAKPFVGKGSDGKEPRSPTEH
jgi:rare lipoprotein A (peptidoglycan hydrolase)